MSVIAANGKPLFRVEVQEVRTATIYVVADTERDARADADELAETLKSTDWSDVQTDVISVPALAEPALDQKVWVDGSEGVSLEWRSVRG